MMIFFSLLFYALLQDRYHHLTCFQSCLHSNWNFSSIHPSPARYASQFIGPQVVEDYSIWKWAYCILTTRHLEIDNHSLPCSHQLCLFACIWRRPKKMSRAGWQVQTYTHIKVKWQHWLTLFSLGTNIIHNTYSCLLNAVPIVSYGFLLIVVSCNLWAS